jgi:WD40 repeat protein
MKKILAFILFLLFAFLQNAYCQTQEDTNHVVWFKKQTHGTIRACKFMPDENLIANSYNDTLQIRRTSDGEIINKIPCGRSISDITFSQDGKLMAVSGISFLKIFDLSKLILIKNITLPKLNGYLKGREKDAVVGKISFSPDASKIVFPFGLCGDSTNSMIYIYDIEKDTIIKRLGDSSQCLTYAKYSPDGNYLAISGQSIYKNLYIYNTNNYEIYLKSEFPYILDIKFNKASTKLGLCQEGSKRFTIISIPDKKITQYQTSYWPDPGIDYGSNSLDFFDDENYILLGARDGLGYPVPGIFNINKSNFEYLYQDMIGVDKDMQLNKSNNLILGHEDNQIALLFYNKNITNIKDDIETKNYKTFIIKTNNDIDYKINPQFQAQIKIFSLIGNTIASLNPNGINNLKFLPFDLSRLIPGIYFIEIQQSSFQETIKIIKE